MRHFSFNLQNGKTALHYAAFKGQLSSVKALVEAGADLDVTDEVHKPCEQFLLSPWHLTNPDPKIWH